MILDFEDAPPEALGELLWDSFVSARLARETKLCIQQPRPEWANQTEELRDLWTAFAARLVALYRTEP